MPWMCERGSCLMVPSGPKGDHLFVVALGPSTLDGYGPAEQVILVSLTTVRPGLPHDQACVVHPGEHSFITHESYVYYREPRIHAALEVQARVNSGVWRPHDSCSAELLQRIVAGFRKSARLPRAYNEILDSLGL